MERDDFEDDRCVEKNALEAAKLLAEWSKWLASMQTAAISLIALATASERVAIAKAVQPGWVVAAVVFFLISVLAASFLLFALPSIVSRGRQLTTDIMCVGMFNGRGIRVVVFAVAQFACFVLGVLCLGVWAIAQATHPT